MFAITMIWFSFFIVIINIGIPQSNLRLWLLVYEYGLSMYSYNYELHFLKFKFIFCNFFIYLKLKFWTFNDKIKWLNLKIKWSLQYKVIIAFWGRGDFIYVNLYSSTKGIFFMPRCFLDHIRIDLCHEKSVAQSGNGIYYRFRNCGDNAWNNIWCPKKRLYPVNGIYISNDTI